MITAAIAFLTLFFAFMFYPVAIAMGVGFVFAIILSDESLQKRIGDRQIWELGILVSLVFAFALNYQLRASSIRSTHLYGFLGALPTFLWFGRKLPSRYRPRWLSGGWKKKPRPYEGDARNREPRGPR